MTEEKFWITSAILWIAILAWSTALMIIKIIKPITPSNKLTRVYEDNTWVIDLIDGNVRVSYFEDNHFVDEIVLSSDYFKEVKE